MTDINKLLESRDDSHGDYDQTARIAQHLKEFLHAQAGWMDLTSCQKEALDMISSKIGRIMAGNANFPDHYNDIAGYSMLVSQRIKK